MDSRSSQWARQLRAALRDPYVVLTAVLLALGLLYRLRGLVFDEVGMWGGDDPDSRKPIEDPYDPRDDGGVDVDQCAQPHPDCRSHCSTTNDQVVREQREYQ